MSHWKIKCWKQWDAGQGALAELKGLGADRLTASGVLLAANAGPPKISHPSLSPLPPAASQEGGGRRQLPGPPAELEPGPGSRRVSDSLAPSAGVSREINGFWGGGCAPG